MKNRPLSTVDLEATMGDVRVAPGKTMDVGEVSVENRTGNSIMVRYDKERKIVVLVDCCLEEQEK